MKFITSFLLAFSLITAAFAAPANKVSQFPTAEQLLPPITAANGGYILSNEIVNGTPKVKWVPNYTQVQADWLATTGPSFIKNKPTIPASQIASDWNQTDSTKPDFIRNKPAITPQVKSDWNAPAGSAAEILNKPTIPAPVPQLQSDWNQTNPLSKDFIKNKPEIGTFAGVNAQTGLTYTLAATDAGKVITLKNAEPITLTVPLDLAVPDGTTIEGTQLDYGWVTIVAAANVKIISPNEAYKTDSIGSTFKLKKIAANTWLLNGDLRSDKQTVPAGKTVILTATALSGSTPYTYQWKKNGVDIAGATQVSLALYSVTAADAGVYVCTVTNSNGSTISEAATLFVTL